MTFRMTNNFGTWGPYNMAVTKFRLFEMYRHLGSTYIFNYVKYNKYLVQSVTKYVNIKRSMR
jgi:hypothetical protein